MDEYAIEQPVVDRRDDKTSFQQLRREIYVGIPKYGCWNLKIEYILDKSTRMRQTKKKTDSAATMQRTTNQ